VKKPTVTTLLACFALATALHAVDLDPSTMSELEWQEYRFERLTAERSSPELAAEGRQIKDETTRQKQAVAAAMEKADPRLTNLVNRLEKRHAD